MASVTDHKNKQLFVRFGFQSHMQNTVIPKTCTQIYLLFCFVLLQRVSATVKLLFVEFLTSHEILESGCLPPHGARLILNLRRICSVNSSKRCRRRIWVLSGSCFRGVMKFLSKRRSPRRSSKLLFNIYSTNS